MEGNKRNVGEGAWIERRGMCGRGHGRKEEECEGGGVEGKKKNVKEAWKERRGMWGRGRGRKVGGWAWKRRRRRGGAWKVKCRRVRSIVGNKGDGRW